LQEEWWCAVEYLCLSVVDRCNLHCGHCRFSKGKSASFEASQTLSDREFLQVASAAVRLGIKKIRISGGEPLVHPNLPGFVSRLTRLPESPEVSLVTNGLLLAEAARELKQAGLARVSIRLDTLRPDRFSAWTGNDGLPRVLAGIEAASDAGLAPRIIVVPIRGVNEDEIVDFARLTLTQPLEVRFTEGPLGGEETILDRRKRSTIAAVREELGRLGILLPVPHRSANGPVRLFRYSASRGTVGVIHGVSRHICGECNRLHISADGRIRCCLLSPPLLDLKPTLRSPSSEKALEEIFRAAAAAKPQPHRLDAVACRRDAWPAPGMGK
jgi:cyclic pyranopterin phosphate synthase